MKREELIEYRERWQAVEELERSEQRRMTDEERLRRFRAILGFGRIAGIQRGPDDADAAAVRWKVLKDNYERSGRE
jgi:hypothetical protein